MQVLTPDYDTAIDKAYNQLRIDRANGKTPNYDHFINLVNQWEQTIPIPTPTSARRGR